MARLSIGSSLKSGAKKAASFSGRRMAVPLAMAGAAAYGLNKGLSSQDLSDPFYQLTLGDPKADESMLGAEISPMSLVAASVNPFKYFSPTAAVIGKETIYGAAPDFGLMGTGLAAGASFAAAGTAAAVFPRSKSLGALRRTGRFFGFGLGAAALSGAASFASSDPMSRLREASGMGLINERTLAANRYYTDEYIDREYSNRMPQVDGSLTFGLYNSRQGR